MAWDLALASQEACHQNQIISAKKANKSLGLAGLGL